MMTEENEWPVNINPDNFPELMSRCSEHITRKGKDLAGYFRTGPEPERLIYEVFEMETRGHLCMAMTVLKPGKVGDEFHMTKGHFHEDDDAGEVYFCLTGKGMIIMQTKEGRTDELALKPGTTAYIPPKWAHRTVNTGSDDLVMLAVYPATSGHDYDSIKEKGFIKRVIEADGGAQVI